MILQWPGYTHWSRKVRSLFPSLYRRPLTLTTSRYQIRLNDWKKAPQRIRLEKLATEVSKCIERFIRVGRERYFPALIIQLTWFVGRRCRSANALIGNFQTGELALSLLNSIVWCSSRWTTSPKGLGSLASASSRSEMSPSPSLFAI